jgi:hypothetical protein
MTEAEERRRFDYDHTGRTPQDYAVEHAGYMANAARNLIECVNSEADARGAWEDAEDDGEEELRRQTLDEKVENTSEALRILASRIYEFEKRRDRAAGVSVGGGGQGKEGGNG